MIINNRVRKGDRKNIILPRQGNGPREESKGKKRDQTWRPSKPMLQAMLFGDMLKPRKEVIRLRHKDLPTADGPNPVQSKKKDTQTIVIGAISGHSNNIRGIH